MSVIHAQVKARGPPSGEDSSIGAQLMRLRHPTTGEPLADEYLLPQITVLFWAGFDTTGNTMAWTLYCISQHPEVRALAYNTSPVKISLLSSFVCSPVRGHLKDARWGVCSCSTLLHLNMASDQILWLSAKPHADASDIYYIAHAQHMSLRLSVKSSKPTPSKHALAMLMALLNHHHMAAQQKTAQVIHIGSRCE